ncbi:CHRD domain-containing protein [Maribellus sp. YY47]|uniref:CHRD domain-containing protein n=1 Tax=Maribellus sp. YY47 TaxID=2929486 RepID=UPI0020011833|nr:CHRD domain-containing protein [Maribellus sp. YY47]MCK3684172.1 CHRD domain-containing protein [Maribellus sp. YY47]
MKTLKFTFLLICIYAMVSCEKSDLTSDLQDEVQLKSAQKVLNFRAHLSGENEVPAVWTDASGQAIFQLNKEGTELSYKLIVDSIENVLMSHIHFAPAGQNGPVVVWLYPSSAPPVLIPGMTSGILAEGVITDANLAGITLMDLIDTIYAGGAYVNVHTSQNRGGEIRGQIKGNMPGGPN